MRALVLAIGLLICATAFSAASPCAICGCNNELCMAKNDGCMFSTCLWKAEYQCYKDHGICEKNKKGECGWRQTKELLACIAQAQQEVLNADPFPD